MIAEWIRPSLAFVHGFALLFEGGQALEAVLGWNDLRIA